MKFTGKIKESNLIKLFRKYEITDKDLKYYIRQIEAGNVSQVIDEFTEKYIVEPIDLYSAEMVGNLDTATRGVLDSDQKTTMLKNVVYGSAITATLLNKNFQTFMRKAYRSVTEIIPSIKVQNTILDETIKQFYELTNNSFNNARSKILNDIRSMQTEMIVQNQRIRNLDLVGKTLDSEMKAFSKQLKFRHPDVFTQINNGDIFTIVKGRKYKLSYYNEMATQTTLMNVDRKSVEVEAKLTKRPPGLNVVEYYIRDVRKLKTEPREICQHILSKKSFNRSLLAVDEATASKLGIQTIDQARTSGAMGVLCRHSIKSVNKQFINSIKKAVA